MALLAARVASLMNYSELSNKSKIPQTTLKRYLSLLQGAYLISEVPAWASNRSKRLVKSPTLHFHDAGVAAHLQGVDDQAISSDRNLLGPLLETFVYAELQKQLSWHDRPVQTFHFRTRRGDEVDFVLERADGRVVGIEVKASQSLKPSHLSGLKELEQSCGADFIRGIILYAGDEIVAFGENQIALPIPCLWSHADT